MEQGRGQKGNISSVVVTLKRNVCLIVDGRQRSGLTISAVGFHGGPKG